MQGRVRKRVFSRSRAHVKFIENWIYPTGGVHCIRTLLGRHLFLYQMHCFKGLRPTGMFPFIWSWRCARALEMSQLLEETLFISFNSVFFKFYLVGSSTTTDRPFCSVVIIQFWGLRVRSSYPNEVFVVIEWKTYLSQTLQHDLLCS